MLGVGQGSCTCTWMGYCMYYESMLDTVLFARDKWTDEGIQRIEDEGFTLNYPEGYLEAQNGAKLKKKPSSVAHNAKSNVVQYLKTSYGSFGGAKQKNIKLQKGNLQQKQGQLWTYRQLWTYIQHTQNTKISPAVK